MARYKSIERGQGYFLTIYPERLFGKFSIEKVIDEFIDNHADLSCFDSKYKNDTTGQKAIAPAVKIKVILYGLSQSVISMRKIAGFLELNHPAYLFLSGGRTIDHSTLCKFLNEFSSELEQIFSQVVTLMQEMGLIDWSTIMIDGTKVSSNASKEFTADAEGFKKKLEHNRSLAKKLLDRARYISGLQEEGKMSDAEVEREKKKISKQQRRYENIIKKIQSHQKNIEEGKQSSKEKVNLTDPDSKLIKDKDSYIQGYNVQAAFSANDILVTIEATSQCNDQSFSVEMIEKVEEVKRANEVEEESRYLMDKGYFNPPVMVESMKKKQNACIAPPVHFEKNWFITGKHDVREEDGGIYFYCQGNRKKRGFFKKKNESYEFEVSRDFCEGCRHCAECWKDKEKNKNRVFSVSKAYVDNRELWKRYNEERNSELWRHQYNKRIGKEHNFRDLKSNVGLSRLEWRGRGKCHTMVTMAGITFNLRKLANYIKDIGWERGLAATT